MAAPFSAPPKSLGEADVFGIVIATISAYIATVPAFGQFTVQRARQRTVQGAPALGVITVQQLHRRRYGWPQLVEVPTGAGLGFTQEVLQNHEMTMQVQVSLPLPARTDSPVPGTPAFTAHDVLEGTLLYLSKPSTISAINLQGLSVLRVGDVQTIYIEDSLGQFETVPAATLMLKYATMTSGNLGEVTAVAGQTKGI